jgi:hypothetical protein
MTSELTTSSVPVRVHYLGLRPSPTLRSLVEVEAARLSGYAKLIDTVQLHVGNWHLHHDAGRLYRVSLEIQLTEGRGELATTRESELNAPSDALIVALRETFETSLSRLHHSA